jgi:phosphoribosylformylglycinamidine cyclo-ligase
MAAPGDAAGIEADLDRLALAHWRIGRVTRAGDGERLKIG